MGYMVRLVLKNKAKPKEEEEELCYDEVGFACVLYILSFACSINNTIRKARVVT